MSQKQNPRQRKISTALVVFTLCSILSIAAASEPNGSRPVYAMQFLTFESGHEDLTFLEVFLQVPTDHLQFIRVGNDFVASYDMSVILYDLAGKEIARGSNADSVKVRSFRETDQRQQPHLIRMTFLLPSGMYKAHFTFTDQETGSAADFIQDITVPDYVGSRLQLSDLQVALSIARTQKRGSTVKNGFDIQPNVTNEFGPEDRTLFVYSEVYNMGFALDRINKPYTATYTIRDKNGSIVKSYGRPHQKQGSKGYLTARLPIDDLDEGEYRLDLTIIDPDLGQRISNSTNFYVYREKSRLTL